MPLSGACGPRIELPQAAVAMVSRKTRIELRWSFMVCTSCWVPAWGRAQPLDDSLDHQLSHLGARA